MIAPPLLRASVAALAFVAGPAAAQFVPQPTPTADALAAQMRQLGANPRDVYALIAAGDLSTKLGDPAAALGFFGRAQAIDPANPRIAAGRAGALVLLERPGEALRLYAGAERAGVAMTPYLAQRGLAYDLIGQPGYAQREYRRALLTNRDDETVRRLALSLGISGRRDEALMLLDPLLRRSDRGAWRARACILAITGDVTGAQTIAASMMNGGAALSPFFSRLQGLSPADRAFAVHFGQIGTTAARANDARLAPALAVLPTEQQQQLSPRPVTLKAPVVANVPDRRDTRRRSPGRESITVAATTPVPTPVLPEPASTATQVAMRDPLPSAASGGAGSTQGRTVASPGLLQTDVGAAPTRPVTMPAPGFSTPWAVTADSLGPGTASLPSAPTRAAPPSIEIVTLPPRRRTQVIAAAPPPLVETRPTPAPTPSAIVAQPSPSLPEPAAVQPSMPAATPISASHALELNRTAAEPATQSALVDPAPTASVVPQAAGPTSAAPTEPAAVAPPSTTPPRTPDVARRNTAMLASIIETIAVPASELDVAPPSRPPARKAAPPKSDAISGDTKKADTKKADGRTKSDPNKTEPARWWVQVAGGANAADLDKDWKRLSAKSPAAFRRTSAWTTPMRATNRLLAGPFKAQAEATTFVKLLAKDGASAFAWQSDAGQRIERLPLK